MPHPRTLATLAAVASATALAAVVTAVPAGATPPVSFRSSPAVYQFDAGTVCDFAVTYTETSNTEKLTFFSDGRLQVTGSYKVMLSRTPTAGDTGPTRSITVNASGPQFFQTVHTFDSPSTVREAGPQLFVMFPGDFRGPGMYLLTGKVVATRAADGVVTSWSTTGTTSENLCGRL